MEPDGPPRHSDPYPVVKARIGDPFSIVLSLPRSIAAGGYSWWPDWEPSIAPGGECAYPPYLVAPGVEFLDSRPREKGSRTELFFRVLDSAAERAIMLSFTYRRWWEAPREGTATQMAKVHIGPRLVGKSQRGDLTREFDDREISHLEALRERTENPLDQAECAPPGGSRPRGKPLLKATIRACTGDQFTVALPPPGTDGEWFPVTIPQALELGQPLEVRSVYGTPQDEAPQVFLFTATKTGRGRIEFGVMPPDGTFPAVDERIDVTVHVLPRHPSQSVIWT